MMMPDKKDPRWWPRAMAWLLLRDVALAGLTKEQRIRMQAKIEAALRQAQKIGADTERVRVHETIARAIKVA